MAGFVEVECERVRESDAAVLIDVGGTEVWIPLSQVKAMHFNQEGKGSIEVAEWLAEKRGLV